MESSSNPEKNVTEFLARFGVELKYSDLPGEVVQEVKRLLLDSVGCGLAGHFLDKGRFAARLATDLGGPPEATIIGGSRVAVSNAAFANGEVINALDFDPLNWPTGHIAPYVIPAALALAERNKSSGKDLILAIALSQEISTRLGLALSTFREPVKGADGNITYTPAPVFGYTCACIGGTVGAGRILDLDVAKMRHAMGIAGYNTPLAPVVKWVRTLPMPMTKYSSGGWTSQAQVTAALLAASGYTGDTTVLDGEYAFWRFYGSLRWEPDKVVSALGAKWLFPGLTEYKIYPFCGIMRKGVDGFIKIMEENQLTPDDIDEVRVYMTAFHFSQPIYSTKDMVSANEAQFSIPYVYAAAAYNLPRGLEWQEPSALRSPKLASFMDKVKLLSFPDFDKAMARVGGKEIPSKSQPTIIEVTARGKDYREEVLYARGANVPASVRLSDDELAIKFRHNAERVLPAPRTEEFIQQTLNLEKLDNIEKLAALVRK